VRAPSITTSPGSARARPGGAGDFRSAGGGGRAARGCARTTSRHPRSTRP
jgi:hypothetical protein